MASIEWVEVLNEYTGERGRISRTQLRLVPGGVLREVDADQKPYIPEMFKPKKEDPTPEEAEDAPDEED